MALKISFPNELSHGYYDLTVTTETAYDEYHFEMATYTHSEYTTDFEEMCNQFDSQILQFSVKRDNQSIIHTIVSDNSHLLDAIIDWLNQYEVHFN